YCDVGRSARGSGLDGESALAVVPREARPRAAALQIILADPIVVVQHELSIRATIDAERRRCGDRLARVLTNGIDRNDGAGAGDARHRRQVTVGGGGGPAIHARARPPVVPVARREIYVPGRGASAIHRCDEEVASPEELVAHAASVRVVRVVEPEGAHER